MTHMCSCHVAGEGGASGGFRSCQSCQDYSLDHKHAGAGMGGGLRCISSLLYVGPRIACTRLLVESVHFVFWPCRFYERRLVLSSFFFFLSYRRLHAYCIFEQPWTTRYKSTYDRIFFTKTAVG
jgi:hypothetical protein